MNPKFGLIGFVNTEEILADTIRRQSPQASIDGYELFPNEAFARLVDNRYKRFENENTDDFDAKLRAMSHVGYAAINLGPDTAAFLAGNVLDAAGIDYIGPRANELDIEIDKTKISEIFPDSTGILPPTKILESIDMSDVNDLLSEYNGEAVIKFVGDYTDSYEDSEYRRVRMLSEFKDSLELESFLRNSVESSGKVIVQKYIRGQQFSLTCIVDGNENIFSLGENIFYKNRFENDQGPYCDGTGSVSINNTLPDLLSPDEIKYIISSVISPYVSNLGERFGRLPKTFLNLDLIKADDERIYLLEVNNRQAGGHTMANLLSGLETPLAEVLQATQEGRLNELQAIYKLGASIVVTAFPESSPNDFNNDEQRPVVAIPKNTDNNDVRIYTGWVDLLGENEEESVVKSNLTATMMFVNHSPTMAVARQKVYSRINELHLPGLAHRTDIGKRYIS